MIARRRRSVPDGAFRHLILAVDGTVTDLGMAPPDPVSMIGGKEARAELGYGTVRVGNIRNLTGSTSRRDPPGRVTAAR